MSESENRHLTRTGIKPDPPCSGQGSNLAHPAQDRDQTWPTLLASQVFYRLSYPSLIHLKILAHF